MRVDVRSPTKPIPPSPQPPRVEINPQKHVAPSSSSWKLIGRCIAYNSSYTIKQCKWKQIYPRPKSIQDTVLPEGTRECSQPTTPSHKVNATIDKLTFPISEGSYRFELSCSDNTGQTGFDDTEILLKELIEPKITVIQQDFTVSTNVGYAKLQASCEAMQGHVANEKWRYMKEPQNNVIISVSEDGSVRFSKPCIYKFEYECTDSYNVLGRRYVKLYFLIYMLFLKLVCMKCMLCELMNRKGWNHKVMIKDFDIFPRYFQD